MTTAQEIRRREPSPSAADQRYISAGSRSAVADQSCRSCGGAAVAVIIVGYHNPDDIWNCLMALNNLMSWPSFDVFIAENGGHEGAEAMVAALSAEGSPCERVAKTGPTPKLSQRPAKLFRLKRPIGCADSFVYIAAMPNNLGYGGAINVCLHFLEHVPGWEAVWVLNPDTQPTPSALAELAKQAVRRGKGMVGSRITADAEPAIVLTCGLQWRKLSARTTTVGNNLPASPEPNIFDIEAQMDAPSGASIYVTRCLIDRIGPMIEDYFLYFEDVEWGLRAKAAGQLTYAHRSVVPHRGGTTIGSSTSRAKKSRLSVYLEFRNRILFVRQQYKPWLFWTIFLQVFHIGSFLAEGARQNMIFAMRGLLAGLRDERGLPTHIMSEHDVGREAMKRYPQGQRPNRDLSV